MASHVYLALAHKPTEFIVQVFAQAVTASKTAWEADCLTCMESQGRRFTGTLSNIVFYSEIPKRKCKVCPDGGARGKLKKCKGLIL